MPTVKDFRRVSFKDVGPPNTPQDVKRLRRENMDMCRRHGEPVVFMHQFNENDVEAGIAKVCPYDYDDDYGATRENCPVCFGVGFVSMEDDPNAWLDSNGNTVYGSDPGTGVHAPLYGGYGPRYLTWMVEPDAAVDVFRISDQGVMVQTQQAQGFAAWFPALGDNDLVVNVNLSRDGFTITDEEDRFQLKRVNPVTVRGFGRRATFQQFQVSQTFEMARIPTNNILQQVPTVLNSSTSDSGVVHSNGNISAVTIP